MPNVLNCQDVTDCSDNSWDLLFCICNGGGCIPASNPANSCTQQGDTHDGDSGLVGVYSTTAAKASTSPSTGGGSSVWSNISNALSDDGTLTDPVFGKWRDSGPFASIQLEPPVVINHQLGCSLGSEYLVLTGYGFQNQIPKGSQIVSIAVGIKWVAIDTVNSIDTYNVALTVGGEMYYLADPRGDGCNGYRSSDPYPAGCYDDPTRSLLVNGWPYTQAGGSWFCSPQATCCAGVNVTPLAGDIITFNGPDGDAPRLTPVRHGAMPGCGNPTTDDAQYFGPIEKNFPISTLKQSWSVDEVNDPSFGVAASFCNLGYTNSNGVIAAQELDVYCMGIAVYYLPGGALRQPNVCINT